MIDLKKVRLPSAVEVEGVFFDVKTDYQYWLCFQDELKKEESLLTDFDFMYENEIPQDRQKGLDSLIEFCYRKNELPRVTRKMSDVRTLDFDLDSDLIYSSFYELYGIDLLNENLHLHYHKFMALLNGIHDTKLSEVIGYRMWKKTGKKYEQQMEELKRIWEIPVKATKEESKAMEEFNSLFK